MPWIVDAGEEGPWLFVVMEMLRGRTLRQYLGGRSLAVEEACDIALMILDGVKAAHSSGILHRDIKLSNVFCCLSPTTGKVTDIKLLDFGIARSLTGEEPTITGSRDLVGSPIYMAPEQLLGEPLSERTDLYSIGVVIYALLAGEVPFRASTAISVGMQIVQGDVPPLSTMRGDISEQLSQVVQKAMALAPGDRYGSAEELADALVALAPAEDVVTVTNSSTSAQPGSDEAAIGSRRPFEERGLTPFVVSALVTVLLLLFGTAWILTQTP